MSLVFALGTGVAVGLAYVLGRRHGDTVVQERVVTPEDAQGWSIKVVATGDPNIYRAVYRMDGNVRYEETGHGVTGAMEALVEAIKTP